MATKREKVGRDKLGIWNQQTKTTICKILKGLLYSIGNCIFNVG